MKITNNLYFFLLMLSNTTSIFTMGPITISKKKIVNHKTQEEIELTTNSATNHEYGSEHFSFFLSKNGFNNFGKAFVNCYRKNPKNEHGKATDCYLDSIVIFPWHLHDQGYGSQLMQAILTHLRTSTHASFLRLFAGELMGNPTPIKKIHAFYTKNGGKKPANPVCDDEFIFTFNRNVDNKF